MFDPAGELALLWIGVVASILAWMISLFRLAQYNVQYPFLSSPVFYAGIPGGGMVYGFWYMMTWPLPLIISVAGVLGLIGILYWKVVAPHVRWLPFQADTFARPLLDVLRLRAGLPPTDPDSRKKLDVEVGLWLVHYAYGSLWGLALFGMLLWWIN